MNSDQREALQRIAKRPRSIAVLAEDLGLSGDTYEVKALCDAIEGLESKGLIEKDPTPGWQTFRWRATSLGLAHMDTRP